MADCPNVEIRELLPERASGALSAADVARVDAHVAGCGMCSDELALITSARLALRRSPRIDVARISRAVVAQTAPPQRPVLLSGAGARPPFRARWIGWKAAAAVAIAAAGGGTMLFANRVHDAPPAATVATSAAAPVVVPSGAGANVVAPTPVLNVAGGLSDLSENELRSLLDDMGSLAPDESFDQPGSVLPDLPGGEGV